MLADLLVVAPEMRSDYAGIQPNPRLDPDSEQRRLLENMVRFCNLLSERAPLLLVLEDIHWADSGTLYLLRHLARRTQDQPVMLLGTYREVELDEALPFHEVLLTLNRQRLGTHLKLERLDREQTRHLLTTIFAEQVSSEFMEGIYKVTEGNPFFIEELCKALVESGDLYYADGEWHRSSMEDMTIPQGVKVTIQSRAKRLTPETQDILLNASVIGREFDYQTLQKVTERDEEILIESLEEAMQAQLIEELRGKGGERFSFAHAMIPAALRESVSGLRRARLHRKVAAAIEALHPEDYERLATHWGEAGDEERYLAFTIKAANRARWMYANADAVRLYTEALDLLPEDHPDRFGLLEGRAKVYDILAEREAQLQDVEAMLALAEEQGAEARRVDALLALAQHYLMTDANKAREPAEKAVALARDLGDVGREGRALRLAGEQAHMAYEDEYRAFEYFSAAVECLQQTELKSETAESMSFLSVIIGDIGDGPAALETAQQAAQLGKEAGDKVVEATTTRRIAIAYFRQHKYAEALPVAEEALGMLRKLWDITGELHAIHVMSMIKSNHGMFEEAEQGFLEMLAMAEEVDQDVGIRWAIVCIRELYALKMGEYEKPLALIGDQLEKARRSGNQFLTLFFQWSEARQIILLGKYERALDILETNLPSMEAMWDQGWQATALSTMGVLKAELGAFEGAHQYMDAAEERCAVIQSPIIEAGIRIRASHVGVREGSPAVLQVGLEEARQAVVNLRSETSRSDLLGWALFAQARLHLALLEADAPHAGSALECTAEALHLVEKGLYFQVLPDVWELPESYLYLHARALRAGGREGEADNYLRRAYEWMTMAAGKIKDEDLRHSYLENVVDNREIAAEFKVRF